MIKLKELYQKYEEIINYLIVGILTTIISLSTYYFCVLTFLDPNNAIELQIANITSWVIAVIFAFFTNRKFVFKSTKKNIYKEFSAFVGSRVLTLLLDMFVMFLIVTVLHGNDKIGKLVTQVLVTVANYLLSKIFVFKKGK